MSKMTEQEKKLKEKMEEIKVNPDYMSKAKKKVFLEDRRLTLINVLPYNRHVLIKPVEMEQKTAGGVILPETEDKIYVGMLVAVAPDCRFLIDMDNEDAIDVTLQAGDFVSYARHNETPCTFKGVGLSLVKDIDIWSEYLDKKDIEESSVQGDPLWSLREYMVSERDSRKSKYDRQPEKKKKK